LLVEAAEASTETELEILDERTARRTHAIVRPWPSREGKRFVALFPELTPGTYSILKGDTAIVAGISIEEGRVTNAEVVTTWG
jgi:hypothetical protein